jgi:BirA family transcriptional regulator, biotin operon repressor / biotin---[acetyl-CoA-carboxylase] ligase
MSTTDSSVKNDLDRLPALLPPYWQVRTFSKTSSTMEAARAHLDDVQAENPLLVIATSQDSGRGRQGRSWISTPGGFYATYCFLSQAATSNLLGLPLVVGLALQQVLSGCGAVLKLKWPNDLLSTDERKLAGILLEVLSRRDKSIVLIGIGINLVADTTGLPTAVSLKELCGRDYTPADIALALSEKLYALWRDFEREGFAKFRNEWLAHACWIGERVEVQREQDALSGTFIGVSPSGSVLLKDGQRTLEVLTGDVVKVRKQIE